MKHDDSTFKHASSTVQVWDDGDGMVAIHAIHEAVGGGRDSGTAYLPKSDAPALAYALLRDAAPDPGSGRDSAFAYFEAMNWLITVDSRRLAEAHQQPGIGLAARIRILDEITAERVRQDAKWGEQNHADGTGKGTQPLMTICSDSTGAAALADLATFATNAAAEEGSVTWRDILLEEVFEALAEDDPAALRTELIQVAAVAAQWAEAIERRNAKAQSEQAGRP